MIVQSFPLSPDGGRTAGRRLSKVLRALRRHRRLRPPQVAAAMGMPLRSYEHFEGGHGRLNVERVSRFAEATDTDPFAILAAMAIDSPGLAVRCADNKLMLLLMLQLQDFDAAVGDDLARLDPRAIMGAFRRAFEELQADAARRAQGPDAWRAALATQPDGQPDPD